jgi:hypothetical protein
MPQLVHYCPSMNKAPQTARAWARWFRAERAGRKGHDAARSRQAVRLGINERQIKNIELRKGLVLHTGTQLLLEQMFQRHQKAVMP